MSVTESDYRKPSPNSRFSREAAKRLGLRSSPLVRAALVLASVGSAVRAVQLFGSPPGHPGGLTANPLAWLALSALLLGPLARSTDQFTVDPVRPEWPGGIRGGLAVAGAGLALLTALTYAIGIVPNPVSIGGWVISQVLWVAAFVPRIGRPGRRTAWALAGLLVLVLIATVPRLWENDRLPLAFHHDLPLYGFEAKKILEGRFTDFFALVGLNIQAVAYIPTVISLAIFGETMRGLAVGATVMIVGSLPAVYLLGRDLFGVRVGIFASVLAAGDFMLISYSRVPVIPDAVFFSVWAMYFLVSALRSGDSWRFVLAGMLTGYAVNSHLAGRIGIPLAVGVVLLAALVSHRTILDRRLGLLIGIASLLIAMGPTVVWDLKHFDEYAARGRGVSLSDPAVWAHTVGPHRRPDDVAGVLAGQFERSFFYFWRYHNNSVYALARPMLEPIGGVLLVLGIGFVVWNLRRFPFAVLAIWTGAFMVASAVTLDPPASHKMLALAAPVALASGYALDRLWAALGSAPWWRTSTLAIGLLIVLLPGVRNWDDYLRWANDPRAAGPVAQIARYLMNQPDDYEVIVVSRDLGWEHPEFRFLLGNRRGVRVPPEELSTYRLDPPDTPAIFILHGAAAFALEGRLQEAFPEGSLRDGSMPPTQDVFHAFVTAPRHEYR